MCVFLLSEEIGKYCRSWRMKVVHCHGRDIEHAKQLLLSLIARALKTCVWNVLICIALKM